MYPYGAENWNGSARTRSVTPYLIKFTWYRIIKPPTTAIPRVRWARRLSLRAALVQDTRVSRERNLLYLKVLVYFYTYNIFSDCVNMPTEVCERFMAKLLKMVSAVGVLHIFCDFKNYGRLL